MLESPNTPSGQRYRCTQERGCALAEVDVPSRDTLPDAAYITLPAECAGRFHQLVIYDAESSEPEIAVTCGPKGGAATDSAQEPSVTPTADPALDHTLEPDAE
jgi:hypothetical protein